MFKHLLTLFFACSVLCGTAHAADPSVGLIVPYKVCCVKQPDGTDQIRFSVLLRTTTKKLVLEDDTADTISGFNTSTHVLQSKASCADLDSMFAPDHKLYGYDAVQVGVDTNQSFGFDIEFSTVFKRGTLCAYLINFHPCCKTPEEALKDIVLLEDTDQLEWVDVGTIGNSGDTTATFNVAPYVNDFILTKDLFDSGTNSSLSLENKICSTARLNFHGKPCCFETFGLKDEDAKGVLLQIIEAFDRTPGDFTATGTWGSCGETQSVKVTGTKNSQIRINVCGKTLCMTDLPSVNNEQGTFALSFTNATGFSTTRCFWSFIRDYMNEGFKTTYSMDPPFMTYGLKDELCRLLDGRGFHRNDGVDYTFRLRLFCVDPDTNTYALAVTEVSEAGSSTFIKILGCRFTLEECKKCCK